MILACLFFVAFPGVVAAAVLLRLLLVVPVILVAAVACAVAVAAIVSYVVAAVYRTGVRGRCKKNVFSCVLGRVESLFLYGPVL